MQKLYEWVFASWVEIFALLISLGAIYYARVSAAAARDAVNEARRTNDIATEANTLTQQSIKIIREAPEAESKLLAIRETEKQIAVSISLALMKHEWERASQEMLTSYRIHATKLPDDLHERARRVSALLIVVVPTPSDSYRF